MTPPPGVVPEVIVITGMSGAGRSQAAAVLEDLGYFVVDNLPPTLITDVVDRVGLVEGRYPRMGLVVDTRGGVTAEDLDAAVKGLLSRGAKTTVLFLDADDAVLARRFEETRRSHPIQAESLADSIAAERRSFVEIRGMSDVIVDTTDLNVHELRRTLEGAFAVERTDPAMHIALISFGFKHGVPRVVDLLFDARFLPNPHWVAELRPQTGLDPDVDEYVFSTEDAKVFFDRIVDLLVFLVPRYEAEGKKYLTIGIGCTGGKHRSVAIAARLADVLSGEGVEVSMQHRDLGESGVTP